MSSEAVTWAKAQRCPSPRAKAVLVCIAAYADAEGRAWEEVSTLIVETELEERTVQRGLADLRRGDPERGIAPLLEPTGDKKLWKGKLIPIYRLPLERGPQNTRERLEMERANEAALPPTPVSPQAVCGDIHDVASGDTGAGLGVTPVSASILRDQDNSQEKPNPGAREAALRPVFDELVKTISPRLLKFADLGEAWNALVRLDRSGEDAALLVGCGRRMAGDPDFLSRKFPPPLEAWIDKGQWRAWLAEAPVEAEPVAEAAAGSCLDDGATAAWMTVMAAAQAAIGDGAFGSYLRPAVLGQIGAGFYLVARTGVARTWIEQNCWRLIAEHWAAAQARTGCALTLTTKSDFEARMRQGSE